MLEKIGTTTTTFSIETNLVLWIDVCKQAHIQQFFAEQPSAQYLSFNNQTWKTSRVVFIKMTVVQMVGQVLVDDNQESIHRKATRLQSFRAVKTIYDKWQGAKRY